LLGLTPGDWCIYCPLEERRLTLESPTKTLEDILERYRINAVCESSGCVNNYRYFDLRLSPPTKVASISRILTDLSIALRLSNPNLRIIEECGIVRLEFFSKDKPSISFWGTKKSHSDAVIPLNLGMSPEGIQQIVDLKTCPHILVSGTTGSGKSTVLHTIIANLLSVSDLNLHLIDTKLVELIPYVSVAKTVSTTYEESLSVLDYLVNLMEFRYSHPGEYPVEVLVIDECADLFFGDEDKRLHKTLLRLVQKCRAAKIHVIMATQRPSAKILDGDVKANFPVKIACKAASKVDSRVVLGVAGAEALLGKGDAYLSDGTTMKRFQCYYSEAKETLKKIHKEGKQK
jgi:S-DNA-T family DNA segregation ATPase FtsK/SpoIIIE